MCGIAGYYSKSGERPALMAVRSALDALAHRGPDDYGYAVFKTASRKARFVREIETAADPADYPDLIFCHRRLSIIDLSAAGRQPMSDLSGNFWIVFNGEVYNYIELRQELISYGYVFRTNTDTEVILYAYAHWKKDCLRHFNGMFAFALWDVREKQLFCARDRMGVKPFYFHYDGSRFMFASEIKAILEMMHERHVNNQTVYDYLVSGLVDHTDDTFFEGVKQLLPAHYMTVSADGLRISRWWDIEDYELAGLTDEQYSGRFYNLLEDSIRLRLRSDVSVGTCLSGGLDSSSIVCIANRLMSGGGYRKEIVGERLKTFSSCFEDRRFDERNYIEDVIQGTGASSFYTFPDGNRLFDLIPEVIRQQDEPFGSTSIFAQWHVMKLVREQGVTVLLDGQGADEHLAGYRDSFGLHYLDLARNMHLLQIISGLCRQRLIQKKMDLSMFGPLMKSLLPSYLFSAMRRMPALTHAAGMASAGNAWIERSFERACRKEYDYTGRFRSSLKNYLYSLLTRYSLPALLRYEDRNAMAFSIEARVPFLDYRLVEYSFSLPAGQKLGNGMTKIVLRNAMKGILPENVRMRADKMGFVTPESVWFRTVLREQIGEILQSRDLSETGYFDKKELMKEFQRFCQGETDTSRTIWRWVNLVLWKRAYFV